MGLAVPVVPSGRLRRAVVAVRDLALEGREDVVGRARVVAQVLRKVPDRLAVAVEWVVADRAAVRPVVQHLLPAWRLRGGRRGAEHSQEQACRDGGEEKAYWRSWALAHGVPLGRPSRESADRP